MCFFALRKSETGTYLCHASLSMNMTSPIS